MPEREANTAYAAGAEVTGGEHLLKTVWHLALATAATFEAVTSETRPRKLLAGAAAGWHVVAALDDFKDFKEARRYAGET